MATKFVASVVASTLLVIASSVGKPLEKVCCLGGKTRVSLRLRKKNRSPERSNYSSNGACALILPLCHCVFVLYACDHANLG